MAVALRGFTQQAYDSDGEQAITLPAGTVAADFCVIHMMERESGSPNAVAWFERNVAGTYVPLSASLTLIASSTTFAIYGGRVPSAPASLRLAASGAYIAGAQTFSGCRGVGKVSTQAGVTTTEADCGLLVVDRGNSNATVLPTADKIHADVANPKNNGRRTNAWFRAVPAAGYVKVDGTNGSYFTGIELLPAAVPGTPTLLSPGAATYVDYGVALPLMLRHNSTSGSPLSAMQVRLRVVGTGTWYYVKADGTLTTTATTLTTSTPAVTVGAAALANDSNYEWQAATSDDGTALGAFSASFTFSTASKPTVSPTLTTSAGDLSPVVDWTETLGTSGQIGYQVRVSLAADADSTGALYDSQVQAGSALTHNVPAQSIWVNGGSYKAWVRVQQTGGQWSAWTASTAETISWTAVTDPTSITASTAAYPLTVTVAGISGRDQIQIQTSPDNTVWTDVLVADVAASSVTLPMPLAPYGVLTYYRARVSDEIDGVQVSSGWVTTSTIGYDTAAYLVSLDGASYLTAHLAEDSAPTDTEGITVSYPLSASRPVVQRTPSQGRTGTTRLIVATQAEKVALLAWLAANPAFTLRFPPELSGSSLADVPPIRMARISPLGEGRPFQTASQARTVSVTWVEQ